MVDIIKSSSEATKAAANAVRDGGIAIVPTNRWYMVCARADNLGAIDRIFRAKKRPLSKQPLFVMSKKEHVFDYFKVTKDAQSLIDGLWPGDLSLILSWKDLRASIQFQAFDQTSALVNNPSGIFGDLAIQVSKPLAATTANVSIALEDDKYGPAIMISEVASFIQNSGLNVDIVIDDGITPTFNHSTILDCRDEAKRPTMIREGYVHRRALNAALGQEIFSLEK